MAPKMEFFRNAQNFTMGNVEFNTVQGDYHDHSVRNVRNTYGNRNRYYTNNSNSFNDHSNTYAGGYTGPSTNYYGNTNNIGSVQNAMFGDNYAELNQGTTTYSTSPPPGAPAGYSAQGPYLRPGPAPGNQDFTASSTAVPRRQGYQQQRGPPPADPLNRPPSGPPMTEGNLASQQKRQDPPPAFPPQGPQGYPQHPPQNPSYRPTASLSPPQQPQPPPQQQKQGSERWPGQYAYKAGMANLKQSSPAAWDNSSESSDTSDEDGSETDHYRRRKPTSRTQKAKKPENPNRMEIAGPMGGGQGSSISVGNTGVSATAAGGARLSVNFGAVESIAPSPAQGLPSNQGLPQAASPVAPPSRGHSPRPQVAQRNPSPTPQRGHSPQPAPPQQQPQQASSSSAPPVAATLQVPLRDAPPNNLAMHLVATDNARRRSAELLEDEDDADSTHESSPSSPNDKKKKKKLRNPLKFFSSSK